MKFRLFYTAYERIPDMMLKPVYLVIDKDGDFVDACSGRMPATTLVSVMERTNRDFPENAPFRLVKWTGKEFVEVTAVS